MFTRSKSFSRNRTASAIVVALLACGPLLAQKPQPVKAAAPARPSAFVAPVYDVKTEVKIKGKVDEIKVVGDTAKTKVTKLVVNNGTEAIELTLGPKSFLDDMGVSYSAGDELEITGSKVKRGDSDEILVREIVKGNDTVVLRNEKGKPYWN